MDRACQRVLQGLQKLERALTHTYRGLFQCGSPGAQRAGDGAPQMGKPIVPEWPGHGRTRGEAGYVDASAFRAVAERLLALQEADAPERQILDFLAALCRAHAEDVMDARAQGFMRRPFGP